jgi:hypothetical protein
LGARDPLTLAGVEACQRRVTSYEARYDVVVGSAGVSVPRVVAEAGGGRVVHLQVAGQPVPDLGQHGVRELDQVEVVDHDHRVR